MDPTRADNAANTVHFRYGKGGYCKTKAACTPLHYVRKMLGSVNPNFGKAEEFIWCARCPPRRACRTSRTAPVGST